MLRPTGILHFETDWNILLLEDQHLWNTLNLENCQVEFNNIQRRVFSSLFLIVEDREGEEEGADAGWYYSQKAYDNDYEEVQCFLKFCKMNYITR